jgi:hypothetical protein
MSGNQEDQHKKHGKCCLEGTLVGVGRNYVVLQNGVQRTKVFFHEITDLKFCCKKDDDHDNDNHDCKKDNKHDHCDCKKDGKHDDHECKKDDHKKKPKKKKPKPPKPKHDKKDDHKKDDNQCDRCSSKKKCCDWKDFDWDKCSKDGHNTRKPFRENSNGDEYDYDYDYDYDNDNVCGRCSKNNCCMKKLNRLIGCEVKVHLNC